MKTLALINAVKPKHLFSSVEEAGFMTYAAASHQGAIEMFWLIFGGAVTLSIFIYSQ